MSIIFRYLTRELLHSLLSMLGILLIIIFCVAFVQYLSMASGKNMTFSDIVTLMGIVLPGYLGYLLPVSLFLSIVIVYGKMFENTELLVMLSGGVSWLRLLKTTLMPGMILTLAAFFLSLYLVPTMAQHQNNLQKLAAQDSRIFSLLRSGQFFASHDSNQVIYIGNMDVKHDLSQDIFIYRFNPEDNQTDIILSQKGLIKANKSEGSANFSLEDGKDYRGTPGKLDYQLLSFKEADLDFKSNIPLDAHVDMATLGTGKLIKSSLTSARSELFWRLSLPLATLVLSVLGLAICYVRPRKSRYSNLFYAVLIFVLYFNLLNIAKVNISLGHLKLSQALGIHLGFLLAGIVILLHREGMRGFRRL